jgi:hypothetical protein
MKRLGLLASLLLAALAASCRYDPAQQDIIDALGPETGTPSAMHRPGQPCLACHSKYQGAAPEFAVAGTVYSVDVKTKKLVPAKNIQIVVLDSMRETHKACSNAAGNFSVLREDWTDPVFPLSPTAGGLTMVSLIGRDGSCASCHKLPDPDNVDSLDPVTGAGRDSAGVIIVDPTQTDPSCGGG